MSTLFKVESRSAELMSWSGGQLTWCQNEAEVKLLDVKTRREVVVNGACCQTWNWGQRPDVRCVAVFNWPAVRREAAINWTVVRRESEVTWPDVSCEDEVNWRVVRCEAVVNWPVVRRETKVN